MVRAGAAFPLMVETDSNTNTELEPGLATKSRSEAASSSKREGDESVVCGAADGHAGRDVTCSRESRVIMLDGGGGGYIKDSSVNSPDAACTDPAF